MDILTSRPVGRAGGSAVSAERLLRRFHAALGKLRAGTYRPKILFVGTSKTMGAGAGTAATNTGTPGAAARNITAHFAALLRDRGLKANRETVCGTNGNTNVAITAAYDPRLAFGAGWYAANGIWLSAGGPVFGCTNAATGDMTFSPAGAVDRLDVWFYRGGAVGEFTVMDGASIVATIDATGGLAHMKQTIALSSLAAGKVLKFNRTTKRAQEIYLSHLCAYDSTTPAVDIFNAGWFGSRSADWIPTDYPWKPALAIGTIAADLTVIALGANDMSQAGSVPVATFATNLQALITRAKVSGDVVLVVESFGQTPSWGTAETQEAYRQAIIAAGAANNCLVVDYSARFGTFIEANALGLFFDGIHESSPGYADEAAALARAIVP